MRARKGKARDTDVVICTRERKILVRREELRIGKVEGREGFYTLQLWGENYEDKLQPFSQIFTADKATLAKIRDALNDVLTAQ